MTKRKGAKNGEACELIEIPFTARLRQQLTAALDTMHQIALTQQMPAPTGQRRRCVDCELHRLCNDVL